MLSDVKSAIKEATVKNIKLDQSEVFNLSHQIAHKMEQAADKPNVGDCFRKTSLVWPTIKGGKSMSGNQLERV